MFGRLKPHLGQLSRTDKHGYFGTYCNLCGHLRLRYGLSARMLVVHDIAALAWLLLETDDSRFPLQTGNCLRGLKRKGLQDAALWRFLAAISAYAIGIKVRDDCADCGGLGSRWIGTWYEKVFWSSEQELRNLGFPVDSLENHLQAQEQLELDRETNLSRAAAPTASCYGLVANQIVTMGTSCLSVSDALTLGRALGQVVYTLDAMHDFPTDRNRSYNPLCLQAHPAEDKLPSRLRHLGTRYIVENLAYGKSVFTRLDTSRQRRWDAIARQMTRLLSPYPRSVILQAACCIPCGDGAVMADSQDCGACFCCLCIGCMCCAAQS